MNIGKKALNHHKELQNVTSFKLPEPHFNKILHHKLKFQTNHRVNLESLQNTKNTLLYPSWQNKIGFFISQI